MADYQQKSKHTRQVIDDAIDHARAVGAIDLEQNCSSSPVCETFDSYSYGAFSGASGGSFGTGCDAANGCIVIYY